MGWYSREGLLGLTETEAGWVDWVCVCEREEGTVGFEMLSDLFVHLALEDLRGRTGWIQDGYRMDTGL